MTLRSADLCSSIQTTRSSFMSGNIALCPPFPIWHFLPGKLCKLAFCLFHSLYDDIKIPSGTPVLVSDALKKTLLRTTPLSSCAAVKTHIQSHDPTLQLRFILACVHSVERRSLFKGGAPTTVVKEKWEATIQGH